MLESKVGSTTIDAVPAAGVHAYQTVPAISSPNSGSPASTPAPRSVPCAVPDAPGSVAALAKSSLAGTITPPSSIRPSGPPQQGPARVREGGPCVATEVTGLRP